MVNERRNDDQQLKALIYTTLSKLESTTYRHRSEREYHMRRTNIMVVITTFILFLIGSFNIYYIYHFYHDSLKIVENMGRINDTVVQVTLNMDQMTATMETFWENITLMEDIDSSTATIAATMPSVRNNMNGMLQNMSIINQDMGQMSNDMAVIDNRFSHVNSGVHYMKGNVRQISKPMGLMNPFMP